MRGVVAVAVVLIPGAALAQHAGQQPVPALFATKAEAEKAAKQFHCTGAHPMGDKWMPCAKHEQVSPHAVGH